MTSLCFVFTFSLRFCESCLVLLFHIVYCSRIKTLLGKNALNLDLATHKTHRERFAHVRICLATEYDGIGASGDKRLHCSMRAQMRAYGF